MTKASEGRVQSKAYVVAEARLTETEARAVLRRQFIGSVAAAVAVMTVVGFMAMRPAHEIAAEASRYVSAVQQPIFVAPADRLVALRQH
jgi:hypothetical protein